MIMTCKTEIRIASPGREGRAKTGEGKGNIEGTPTGRGQELGKAMGPPAAGAGEEDWGRENTKGRKGKAMGKGPEPTHRGPRHKAGAEKGRDTIHNQSKTM